MSTDASSDVKFEIAHVLFMDVVGYSKLLIDDQRQAIHDLKEIVRATEQFRAARIWLVPGSTSAFQISACPFFNFPM